ncbi:TRAP transporter small permease [uncultured Tateyamaria sp.]|uniref:TRAP transporter small permease n=1 Tax=uncultured Tateyamaria sp. TaxID=455651 RepID=UPI002613ED9C|nr:TRAP transporter small permease [uncultured Tateyamaria sp.]
MSSHYQPKTALGRIVNEIEETAIALILASMTILTFINVVLRYGYKTGLTWGLEAVSFLFAWLVLFGASYAVKVTAHLGVDAVINLFSPPVRRIIALVAAAIFVFYAMLLMKGAWDYWAPFAGFDVTSGRWFPTGFTPTRDQAWYEVLEVPMLESLRWIEPIMNEGEAYEKMPRFIPYAALPFGMALLLFRVIQAAIRIFKGEATSMIVSHEAEDEVEAVKHMNEGA